MLYILIGVKGRVVHAEVYTRGTGLDEAALKTVRQWVFAPALKDRRPIPQMAITIVPFGIK